MNWKTLLTIVALAPFLALFIGVMTQTAPRLTAFPSNKMACPASFALDFHR